MQIRDVTAADVPAIAALADAKRTEYAAYSPIFWRKSDQGVEVQTRFFTNRMLPSDTVISLVADNDGTIEGFVIGMVREAPPVYDPGGPSAGLTILQWRTPICGRRSAQRFTKRQPFEQSSAASWPWSQ